ncbi:hypothetical protein M011DRAFT_479748 [Sporormia fimetaria CBS 119925]|uniref:Uncharacterized protein n=1 Tax=Sporormia fimetaria CBS 119925 TaxID=1340428 RepID=A0A6A6V5C7_9PLEO|nr:hypothetical protein M011DRAFT_479748 [Sporormia fimetaria CBS 119925]
MARGSMYEGDIPSLSASLEAFDPEHSVHAHSMRSSRWSATASGHEAEESEADLSDGPWAPPAWQRSNNIWYRKSLLGESASRSPFLERATNREVSWAGGGGGGVSNREVTPSRIPLPDSPLKMTPRTSPEPVELQYRPDTIASRLQSMPEEPHTSGGAQDVFVEATDTAQRPVIREGKDPDGFVKLSVKGETLFRLDLVEDVIHGFKASMHMLMRTRLRTISTLITLLLAYLLTIPWNQGLIPDIANVANMAKQFEPLMYASENVIPRSRELADASIAVQDLGESVRATNMSASTAIIDQLDSLGDSLKVLSEKLTSFFIDVDGDMDSILITMEWTKRELSSLHSTHHRTLDTVLSNTHHALSKLGVLTHSNGTPTPLGRLVTDVLGQTAHHRSKATLQRTFDYLLTTLEENIANELSRADTLFALFESVDRQFQNLHRSVAKEEDSLATRKDEFLASMWRSSIKNQVQLKKYERNLKLLKSVRASTLTNKSELKTHIQVILSVKEQLDRARRNLMGPLLRRAQSSEGGLERQLEDLGRSYGFLKKVREEQKYRVLKELWKEGGRKRVVFGIEGEDGVEGLED